MRTSWATLFPRRAYTRTQKTCPHEICVVKPINGTMLCSGSSDANGAGDGVLFYPGTDGPLSSIRLENIADGLEDYELFRRLANSTRRDELITRLVQSGDLWTDSPTLLEEVRREAAASVIAEGGGRGRYSPRLGASSQRLGLCEDCE